MIAPVWRPAALLLAASQRNCAVRVRADAVRRVGVSTWSRRVGWVAGGCGGGRRGGSAGGRL